MVNKHNNIKRLIHRILEELKACYDVGKAISMKAAFVTFRAKVDLQIINRHGYKESHAQTERLLRKHKIMLDFLDKEFKEFWDTYKVPSLCDDDEDLPLRKKIWICWWQGLENAPEIVNACVSSICKNSGDIEVIVITDKNVNQYVQFPKWLERKRESGIISRTIFSDLLRVNILSRYGGIWIDSTFFCTRPCVEDYVKMPLWSIKRPNYGHLSVACGFFANYSLACNYGHRSVFTVIRDMLYYYWEHHDRLIDYLLTDYVIVLAQKHYRQIADAFSSILPNNPRCDDLFKVLGDPYDEKIWADLKKDTSLFKLTWKQTFPKEVDGKKTFYGMLLDNQLA
jgi:hypothetical protein